MNDEEVRELLKQALKAVKEERYASRRSGFREGALGGKTYGF
jgi:hypothetical protein